MTVNPIILADGRQERWPARSPPKELLEVDNEPILLRTIRLFEQRLQTLVYVYTRKPEVIARVAPGQRSSRYSSNNSTPPGSSRCRKKGIVSR